uniref:Mitogen-activated protein kinase kinase kinase 21-like n=1 Tax=Dermatophagoides pteronyssinus TaxID=6956 RepID=A0A6P6Y7T0_DERPT
MIVAKYCDEPPVDYSDDDDDDGGEEEDLLQNGTNKFHRYEYQDDCISFQSATTTTATTTTSSSLSSIPPILSTKSKHLYEIPTINFNRLQFEKLIGRGGFGQVYRGQYQQELVAIKEPIYHQQKSIEMINDSLKEEARLQFYLDHPNIIKIYGLSMNHRKIYLVMEYASGKSLQELLQKHNLSPTIIINFAKQISSAMEYLHNFKPKPIIHRDLKSSNILLDQPIGKGRWLEKQLKLTDLGLARELTDSTSMMTPCGTYAWMAPESITHSKFSKASDVWSFGVVLWELLTAEIPYKNIAGAAVAYGIGNRQLTLPIPKNCPEELKHILQECWQQEPSLRPSFQKIRNDLEKSSFNVINMEQFKLMKKNWFEEIWKSLKEKEKELQSREKKAELKEAKMNEIERSLQEKSKRLTEREIEVVGRELKQILEQNEQKNFQRNKSINRKKDGRPPLISYPKDFCHNVTVMKTSLEHSSQPSLQAKTLNKTWTPGTKIRRELHTDLFVNVSRTSSMSQDTDCADVECYHQQQQQQSSSVSSSKMKKIGRFLKRIFGHNDDDHSLLNDNNHRPHEQRSIFHIDSEDNIVDNDTNALVMLSLNRTYHGQTKYSQRIPFWESFQPPPTTTTTNTKTTSTTMNQTASYEWQHDDNDDEFDDEEDV